MKKFRNPKWSDFHGKMKLMLIYTYYHEGMNWTNILQLRYVAGILGLDQIINQKNVFLAIVFFMGYSIINLVVGYFFVTYFWTEKIEIGNLFNKFVHEMRRKIK